MLSNIMKINAEKIKWLTAHFPNLQYDANSRKIVGELDFHAAYDSESGKMIIGKEARGVELFLYDVFEIEIYLDICDRNGLPKIYEVGGRHHQIAKINEVNTADLHFYTDEDNCCLGIKYGNNSGMEIETFFYEFVIPFFYRLSYTEHFGIDETRKVLWGEYPHGKIGIQQYEMELLNFMRQCPVKFRQCPCGSGKKYINCHYGEVEDLRQALDKPCFCGSRRKYRNCHFKKVKY